jgi:hypothetical protein
MNKYISELPHIIQIPVTVVVARVAGLTVIGTVAFGLTYVSMFKYFPGSSMDKNFVQKIKPHRLID